METKHLGQAESLLIFIIGNFHCQKKTFFFFRDPSLSFVVNQISYLNPVTWFSDSSAVFSIPDCNVNDLTLGTLSKKKRHYLGIFPNMGGGVFPNPKTFVNLPSIFFVCQIHSEVLKHVLQKGG